MRQLLALILPESVEDFSGPRKKNAFALFQEESDGDDAGEVFLFVFWGIDAILPHLEALREPENRPQCEEALPASGLPAHDPREPLWVGGWVGMELGFLCANEQDDDAFDAILIEAGTSGSSPGLLFFANYREGEEDETIVFAYVDDEGVEHLHYFTDTETAMRVVAGATALTVSDREEVLERILETCLPDTSAPSIHFEGFTATYLRGVIQTASFLEHSEDESVESGDNEEEEEPDVDTDHQAEENLWN